MTLFELLGFAGISLSAFAYAPQAIHLAREHCSAGVSGRAWSMWLASAILVGAVALQRGDPVFVGLQVSTMVSAIVILYLTHRYRGMVCATHALDPVRRSSGTRAALGRSTTAE